MSVYLYSVPSAAKATNNTPGHSPNTPASLFTDSAGLPLFSGLVERPLAYPMFSMMSTYHPAYGYKRDRPLLTGYLWNRRMDLEGRWELFITSSVKGHWIREEEVVKAWSPLYSQQARDVQTHSSYSSTHSGSGSHYNLVGSSVHQRVEDWRRAAVEAYLEDMEKYRSLGLPPPPHFVSF
jgi:hypothetical protein